MKNFYNYLLFWVLVMISLPFIFVSEVKASEWMESNVYESVDGPNGRGTQSYTNRCNVPTSFGQPYINDYPSQTIDPHVSGWNFYCTPANEFNIGTTTDNFGNVTTEVTQVYTTDFRYHIDRYDIDLGYHNDKYIRYEFIIRVYGATYNSGSSATITDSNLVNKYLSTFMVSPVYNQCSVKFGFNNNPNDLGVSCLIGPGEDLNFVMSNMTNQNTAYRVIDSNFRMVLGFNITQASIVWSKDITGLQYRNGSVLGDFFNVDYQVIQDYSNSFFNNFSTPNFNNLGSLISSPLTFIRSLNPENIDSLNFSIFGKTIILPNGNKLFWKRPLYYNYKTFRLGSYTCNYQCWNNLHSNFQVFWNVLFGGALVYLSLKKLFKTIYKLIDPTNSEIEVF